MGEIIIPQGYVSALNLHDTQVAIKTVKDFFQQELTKRLNLLRVTAPLFVNPETGLNDNLNGVERPVSFELKDMDHTQGGGAVLQTVGCASGSGSLRAFGKYLFSSGKHDDRQNGIF